MKKEIFKTIAATLLLAIAYFSCVLDKGFCSEVVRIGLMAPLTGKWASEGQDMRQIVSLLVKKVNIHGGINGKPIDLIIEDDAGDPRVAALAAQKLVSSGVIAIIGTYGSAVTEATQNIINESGIVQIATGSTSVRLTQKGLPLFFRTSPHDNDQGKVAADVLMDKGYSSVAIVHDNSSYSKGLAQEVEKLLKAKGIPVVFFDALTPGEQDYTVTLTKLRSTKPDIIFFTGYYPEAGMLLRQKAEMHWNVPMMGGDATNNIDLVRIAGEKASEGYFFISPPTAYNLDNPQAKKFFSEYKEEYHTLPQSVWSVFAGDAFNVIVDALKKAKEPTHQAIASLLKNSKEKYNGLTGQISFDQHGDRVGKLYKLYVVNQKGVFVPEE